MRILFDELFLVLVLPFGDNVSILCPDSKGRRRAIDRVVVPSSCLDALSVDNRVLRLQEWSEEQKHCPLYFI